MYKTNIRKLPGSGVLKCFSSGESIVDDFLRQDAMTHEKHDVFSTTLFFTENRKRIVGFYSLAASIIEVKNPYDASLLGSLDMDNGDISIIPFPAIELTWLGVDKQFQGKRHGAMLLKSLFQDILVVRDQLNIGISGVQVSALPGAVEFYQHFGFKYLHMNYDRVAVFPETYPLFIGMRDIREIVQ